MILTKAEVRDALHGEFSLIDNRSTHQYLGVNRHAKAKRGGTIVV